MTIRMLNSMNKLILQDLEFYGEVRIGLIVYDC